MCCLLQNNGPPGLGCDVTCTVAPTFNAMSSPVYKRIINIRQIFNYSLIVTVRYCLHQLTFLYKIVNYDL